MSFLGSIGSALGTNSNYQADPMGVNATYIGPSQGTLGGYLQAAQGQEQNTLNSIYGPGGYTPTDQEVLDHIETLLAAPQNGTAGTPKPKTNPTGTTAG